MGANSFAIQIVGAAFNRRRSGHLFATPFADKSAPTESAPTEFALTNPGSKALRKGRVSIAGQIYLVTFCTLERRRWFDDFEVACKVAASLASPATWPDCALLAWVLMPDHAHLILQLGDSADLSRAVKRAKAVSALSGNTALGRTGSLWMPGFHDRALRRDEALLDVARYVIANPLRAGLVKKVGDYPFWDAVWLGDPELPGRE